jgi:hypothetical protein
MRKATIVRALPDALRQVAEAHGGTVTAEPAAGDSSIFGAEDHPASSVALGVKAERISPFLPSLPQALWHDYSDAP